MGLFSKEEAAAQAAMPMPQPQRRQMRISDQAAAAAQHVLNLEDENDQLRSQYSVALNRIALLETNTNDLKRTIADLTQERDDYKHHYSHIWGALQHAGAILVECMRVPARAVDNNGDNNDRIQAALSKVEQTITGEAVHADDAKAVQ